MAILSFSIAEQIQCESIANCHDFLYWQACKSRNIFLGKTLRKMLAIYHAWGSEIDQIRMLADKRPPISIKNVQPSKYDLVLGLI